jgi:hypothetical protein
MRRPPQPLTPSMDGARILIAIAGLTAITAALLVGALVVWGAL